MIADKNLELATAWQPTPAVGAAGILATTWDAGQVALSVMTDPANGDATIAAGDALRRDVGVGEPVFLVFTVNAVATGSTSASLRVITSDNADGSSPTTLCQTPSFDPRSTGISVGQQIAVRLDNPLKLALKRYIGVSIYNNSGAPVAALSLKVHVVHGDQTGPQVSYPTAFIAPDGF